MSGPPIGSARELKIRAILDDLITQRRRMDQTMTEQDLLEANRLSIVYWRWQLSLCRAEEHADAAALGRVDMVRLPQPSRSHLDSSRA